MTPEQATFLADQFVSIMERELKTTAKVLKAVPDSAWSYKPDEKSRTAGDLAKHIAHTDVWFVEGVLKVQQPGMQVNAVSVNAASKQAEQQQPPAAAQAKNGGKEECLVINVEDTFGQFGESLAYKEFDYLWTQRGGDLD